MIELSFTKTLRHAGSHLTLDVGAEIATGCFATLFGPSGAGKTTVLRVLAGLTHADSGRIVVDGDVWFDAERGIELAPQRRAIGFVFQDQALFPHLNVRQNVAYASEDAEWIDELLEMTGLTSLQQRTPHMLSGGQKQRVALARAVARRPRLLLLDEPLSALDAASRTGLQDVLLRLHQRLGLTTLLVSHDLGEVFKLSQQVLRMDRGRIVESGSPSHVFLRQRPAGDLHLHAQVLEMRREDVVWVLSLLIGQDIVEIIASEEDIAGLHQGDIVLVSARTFSPALFSFSTPSG